MKDSDMPPLFQTGCPSDKRSYLSRKDAKKALRRLKGEGALANSSRRGDSFRPYRCPECELFHLGHWIATPLSKERFA